ncbi:MAG TPA: B12-binding domain-containing radical SAM protein, partial [Desulfobacteraceae bacterium]|nr:B12-binding domain-containing radical SAM protein [Desulfobacteraceae bacterium]
MMNSEKNRVLLIYPASDSEETGYLPLSLMYIAQPLLENNIEVEIIDHRYENDLFSILARQMDSGLICIGMNCITGPHIEQVQRICEFVKERSSIPIVLGGPHPTLLPEQTLQSGLVDYVVMHKGEAPFLRLVKALKMDEPVGHLKQIGWRENGRIYVNRDPVPEIQVRIIPYHLILKYGKPNVIPIITSYGCPYHCSFCVERVLHPKYTHIPMDVVLSMIGQAMELKPALINFIDDNFLLDRKRVIELLSMCQKNDLNFYSLCTGRVDEVLRMDDESLRFMRNRGLTRIFFGIESGSPRILNMIRKRLTVEMVLDLNRRLRNERIIPHYSFMAGFPTETKEDIEKTIHLIHRLKKENPESVIWKINKYVPYPGTELFDLAVQQGFNPPKRFE